VFAAVVVVGAGCLATAEAWAMPSSAATSPFSEERALCEAKIDAVREEIRTAKWWGNVCLIGGATIAGLGSAFAGFLNGQSARRVSAVVGALGAILAVVPKVLPDAADAQARLVAAERHRLPAEKLLRQLVYLNDDDYKVTCAQYASARFVECASEAPSKEVPDLPIPLGTGDPRAMGRAPSESTGPSAGQGAPANPIRGTVANGDGASGGHGPVRPTRPVVRGGGKPNHDALPAF